MKKKSFLKSTKAKTLLSIGLIGAVSTSALGISSIVSSTSLSQKSLNIPKSSVADQNKNASTRSSKPSVQPRLDDGSGTTAPRYSVSNPYTSPELSKIFAYQWENVQIITSFIYIHLSDLFYNVNNITENSIHVIEDSIRMNDTKGEVIVSFYFDFWWLNGSGVNSPSSSFTLKFTGFKKVQNQYGYPGTPVASNFKFKSQNYPLLPSDLLRELESLNGPTLDDAKLTKLSNRLYFGPLPTASQKFKYNISGSANNIDGSLDLFIKVNGIFTQTADDSSKVIWTDFETAPFIFSLSSKKQSVTFKFKGITQLTSTAVDVNKLPYLDLNSYNAMDFMDAIKNPKSALCEQIRFYITDHLIISPKGKNFSSKDVVLMPETAVPDYATGFVRMKVTFKNFVTIDSTVDKEFEFIFINEPISLPTFTQIALYPVGMNPMDAFRQIERETKNSQLNTFYKQKFSQLFMSISGINYNTTKLKKVQQREYNSQKNTIKFKFTFSNIKQQTENGIDTTDYTTDWLEYQFYSAGKETSILDPISVTNNDILDGTPGPSMYPYVASTNKDFIKDIIINRGTVNKPGPVQNGVVNVDYNKNDLEITNVVANNATGSLEVTGKLFRYLVVDEKGNTKLENTYPKEFQTRIVNFKKVYAETIVTRNNEYIDLYKDILPTDFAKNIEAASGDQMLQYFKRLINIYNHPYTNDKGIIEQNNDAKFANARVIVVPNSADNKLGKIDLKFSFDGKFNNDPNRTYQPNNWTTEPITFYFLKVIDNPTQAVPNIDASYLDTDFQQFTTLLAKEIVAAKNDPANKPINDDIVNSYTKLTNVIKRAITEKGLKFLPKNFSPDRDFNINSLNILEQDINGKWIKVSFRLTHYIDENGKEINVDNTANVADAGKEFTTVIHANFRNVNDTRFIKKTHRVKNVQNIKASQWLDNGNNMAPAIDFLYELMSSNQTVRKVLTGDIPSTGEFGQNVDLTKNDILIRFVSANDNTARVECDVSLKKYWTYDNIDKTNKIVTNEQGYEPWTRVTFTGFNAPGITIWPSDGEKVQVNSKLAQFHASDLINNDTSAEAVDGKFTTRMVKEFLMTGQPDEGIEAPIYNMTKDMTWEDVGIFTSNDGNPNGIKPNLIYKNVEYICEPNDITGELRIQGRMRKYWYFPTPDSTSAQLLPPDNGENNGLFDFVLTGFNKRTPTTITAEFDMSTVIPQNDFVVATDLSEENKLIRFTKQYLVQGEHPRMADYVSVSSIGIKPNNLAGELTFTVLMQHYYSEENGLLCSISNSNKVPTGEQITPKNVSVRLFNFNRSSETKFINKPEYTLKKGATLSSITSQTMADLLKANPQDEQNPFVKELKDIIFRDIIIQGKERLEKTNVFIENISHSNKDGSLTIKISLNKYWDANGELQEVQDIAQSQKVKEIKILGFKKTGKTIVDEVQKVKVGGTQLVSLSAARFEDLINRGLATQETWEFDVTKGLIFDQNVASVENSYTENMDKTHIWITGVSTNPNDPSAKDEAVIRFKFKKGYWNDMYDFDTNESKEYTVTLKGFKTVSGTEVQNGRFNIATKYYNMNGDKFGDPLNPQNEFQIPANTDISQKTISQWTEQLTAAGLTVQQQLENYVRFNYTDFMFDPAPQFGVENNDFSLTYTVDNTKGEIVLTINVNRYKANDGQIVNKPDSPKIATVTLYGFLKVGKTEYTNVAVLPAKDELKQLIDENNIKADEVTYDEATGQLTGPANILDQLTEILKQFLRKYAITGYAPSQDANPDNNITAENIVIDRVVGTNAFDGIVTIEFHLDKYYNENGVMVQGILEPKKTISISGFVPPKSKGPTVINDGSKPISSFIDEDGTENRYFVDAEGKGIKLPDIFSQLTGQDQETAISNLKKFIFEKFVTGNKDGLSWQDVQIMSGFNDYNNKVGTINISYRLKKYWSTVGPVNEPSSPYKDIVITNFLKIEATKPVNKIHDFVHDGMGYKFPPNTDAIRKQIETTEASKLDTDAQFKASVENYIKEFVIINRDLIFTNLPKPLTDEQFAQAITIDGITPNSADGTVAATITLKTFVEEDGSIVTIDQGISKTFSNIQFVGFLVPRLTSIIHEKAFIDVSTTATPSKNHFYNRFESQAPNGSNIAWCDSTPKKLFDDMIAIDPNNWNASTVKHLFEETIKDFIRQNLLDNGQAVGNNKIVLSYNPANDFNDAYGKMYISYEVRAGYEKDENGNFVFNPNLKNPLHGKLELYNFKKSEQKLNSSKIVIYATVFGILAGVLFLFIIILIIAYRRRNDIEYRQ